MKLSIISPSYNEEEVLPFFLERAEKVCKKMVDEEKITDYEIVIVDDGSIDNTWKIITKAHLNNPKIKGIKLSRNFGHQSAIRAGFDFVDSDFVVFMDSDLQAKPEDIEELLKKINEGFDIVWGLAGERHDSWLVRFTSDLFYFVLNRISKIRNPKGFIMVAICRNALLDIKKYSEVNRFNHGLWASVGYRTAEILLVKEKRAGGKVKLNFLKRLSFALSCFIGFSNIPLRISIFLGFFTALVSSGIGLYFLFRYLMYNISTNYLSTVIIIFLFGVMFVILGILGEYIGIIMDEVKKRPNYFIEDQII